MIGCVGQAHNVKGQVNIRALIRKDEYLNS